MTDDQISEWTRSIYLDLRKAVSSWEVWKEIRSQRFRQQAGHYEFFDSVQIALLDSVILAISRVLDKYTGTISIPNLVEAQPKLLGSGVKQHLDDLSSKSEPTFHKIKLRRNQHIAHQDEEKDELDDPLGDAEIEKFIESLVDAFQELEGFLHCAEYEFGHIRESRKRETTKVMAALQKDWESRGPRNSSQG